METYFPCINVVTLLLNMATDTFWLSYLGFHTTGQHLRASASIPCIFLTITFPNKCALTLHPPFEIVLHHSKLKSIGRLLGAKP